MVELLKNRLIGHQPGALCKSPNISLRRSEAVNFAFFYKHITPTGVKTKEFQ